MVKHYKTFDRFILRTPQKPLKDGFSVLNKNDFNLELIKSDVKFIESLYLSSKELVSSVENYKILSDSKLDKLKLSLLKYYIRACTRCTPFGLYSSCSLGNYSVENNKTTLKKIKRVTRLDMNLLVGFSHHIIKESTYSHLLKFQPNTSLYQLNNQYRYIEYEYKKEQRNYKIEAIANNFYLEKIIDYSKTGKTIPELRFYLKKLSVSEDFTSEQINGFINSLITYQILISELEPSITGTDYLKKIISTLEQKKTNSSILTTLVNIDRNLDQLDNRIVNEISDYGKILKKIESLGMDHSSKNTFQTDSILSLKNNTLKPHIPKQILNSISFISNFFHPQKNTYLEDFKKEFIKKYEGREMSLAFLMDSQTGLEFINNSLNNFTFIENIKLEKNKRPRKITLSENYNFFHKKLEWVIDNNLTVLELKDSDVKDIKENKKVNLPNTFYSLIEYYNQDDKEFIYLNGASGTTATNLISRFSQQSKEIKALVLQITEKEKEYYTNKILAEIIHLPQSRTGNILKSKLNRDYEIVYLANSELKKENQILIKDLVVKIKHDRIILYSTKLKKEIIPILSNAHNYNLQPLPVYNFLCELQHQGNNDIGFYWDNVFLKRNYLPRVIYKNIIFSKARWLVNYQEIKELENFDVWRKKREIPKYVQLKQSDNLLLLDLDNTFSKDILLTYAKKSKQVIVQEFLFNTKNGKQIDNEVYTNQYIIPFYKTTS